MDKRQVLGLCLVAGIAYIAYKQEFKATAQPDSKSVVGDVAIPYATQEYPAPAANSPTPTEAQKITDSRLEERDISKWVYQTNTDDMRGVKNKWAVLESDNTQQFRFPYNGGSRLRIVIRSMPKTNGQDVYLEITKGQVDCGYDGCKIPMKFDSGKVVTYTGSRATGGHSDTIFISEKSGFLKRIKAAKHLMIEVPVWKQGATQFSFSTPGLDWK